MTKRIVSIILVIALICILTGCNHPMSREKQGIAQSMFVIVDGSAFDTFYVVYNRETKVMYAVSNGTYNTGNFTVLVNPDGSPMLWESQ